MYVFNNTLFEILTKKNKNMKKTILCIGWYADGKKIKTVDYSEPTKHGLEFGYDPEVNEKVKSLNLKFRPGGEGPNSIEFEGDKKDLKKFEKYLSTCILGLFNGFEEC